MSQQSSDKNDWRQIVKNIGNDPNQFAAYLYTQMAAYRGPDHDVHCVELMSHALRELASARSSKAIAPTHSDLLTLLDELEGIQAGYETASGETAKRLDAERLECRTKIRALFSAAQDATYPTCTVSASASSWIPVGERLPSPHTDSDFIVATTSGYVTAMNFGEHGWYSGHSSDDEDKAKDGYWNGCITHWQELPAAPAGKKATTLDACHDIEQSR